MAAEYNDVEQQFFSFVRFCLKIAEKKLGENKIKQTVLGEYSGSWI